jgi:formylglycine-generating enzyme required for sulfatase activity
MKNSVPFLKTKTILLSAVFIFISLTMISVSDTAIQHSHVPDNMVFIKGGCFQMGDIFSDVPSNEKPVHEVCVDDFYMGKYEVTLREFRKFVKETEYRTEAEWQDGCHSWAGKGEIKKKQFNWRNTNFPQTERDPVICVSWNDANEFIKWLNEKAGRNFRLPTEAEWEYAARSGGKKYKYSWGSGGPSENIADVTAVRELLGITDGEGYSDGYALTSPVGSFTPNESGLYDMSGNVSEWVADWFGKNYYRNSPKNNPKGPLHGKCKALRGGSWNPLLRLVQTTTRRCSVPGARGAWLGFRIAHPVK